MAKSLTPGANAPTETVAPTFATIDHGHDLPRIPPSPMFAFVFSPGRYMVSEGCLVPQLSTFPLVQGVNLVEMDGKGNIKASKLQARLAEEGRTMVPFSWAPDGKSYIKRVSTRQGANTVDAYISVWERAYPGGDSTRPNSKEFTAWLQSLVTDGKLPPCPQPVAERMLERAIEAHAQAVAESNRAPSGKAQLRAEALGQSVAVLQDYLEGFAPAGGETVAPDLGEEPPKPKPRRRAKTPKAEG